MDDAAAIKNVDIASELCLPPVKREYRSNNVMELR